LFTRLKASVSDHLGAWLLFGLFIFAEYWNYHHAKELTALCETVSDDDVIRRLDLPTQAAILQACDERLAPPEPDGDD
jgi:hypothetical protein